MKLEPHAQCSYDSIQFLDLADSQQSSGLYCEQTSLDWRSTSNEVQVVFRTDHSVTYRGFKGEFFVLYKCDSTITRPWGYIESPGYPIQYAPNTVCSWTIVGPAGSKISLRTIKLQLETHSVCQYDYMQVLDGSGVRAINLGRYCNSEPPVLQTTSNIMQVSFRADGSGEFMGFSALYSIIGRGNEQVCDDASQCPQNKSCISGYCACASTTFFQNSTNQCTSRFTRYESCTENGQCKQSLLCRNGVCNCSTDQYFNVTSQQCLTRLSRFISCNESSQCKATLSCIHNQCNCSDDEYYNGTTAHCHASTYYNKICILYNCIVSLV
ncbi:tolloid-like protein 2 [Physella acuta]|uniref:tolloid-like protein 2 n=1 Tax=Physella acuta TaxID=109671 RepID=UPI0027DD846E|nr:tolloid-like protein 2 [Physella acuta]